VKRLRLTSPINTTASFTSNNSSQNRKSVSNKFSSCFSLTTKSIAESILTKLETSISINKSHSEEASAEADYDLLKLNDIESDTENNEESNVEDENDDSDDDDDFGIKINKNKLLLDVSTSSNCSANTSLILNTSSTRRCLFKQSQFSGSKNTLESPRSFNSISTVTQTKTNVSIGKQTKQITPISCYKTNIISAEDASLVDYSLSSIEKSLSINSNVPSRIETIDEMLEECYSDSQQLTNATNPGELKVQHEIIMSLLDQEYTANAKLIGDRSGHHILPCTNTNLKHSDLNCITPATMTKLLDGEYDHLIDKLIIIDSRYPYEFEGGHIRNAQNIYTKERIIETFLTNKDQILSKSSSGSHKRTVIIFHCEFSSERGPSLLRFLRNQDRAANRDSYPKLYYPELYLLEGGYKAFFEDHTVSFFR
jgi:hypothetical protein